MTTTEAAAITIGVTAGLISIAAFVLNRRQLRAHQRTLNGRTFPVPGSNGTVVTFTTPLTDAEYQAAKSAWLSTYGKDWREPVTES